MTRTFAILAALTVPLLVSAAPQLRTPDPAHPVGKWTVAFANGVIEASEFGPDGAAAVDEPHRAAPGRWKEAGVAVVVTFTDDRVERWTKDGTRWQVEHWFPAAAYPAGSPVVGVARRLP